MKYKRQEEIKKIVSEYNIETQDELIVRLRDRGYEVTQATVSRDIRELHLIKVALGANAFKYSLPVYDAQNYSSKYQYIIKETVVSIESAQNLIVVKTLPGMANAAAAAIDGLGWNEAIGSIAGDDTIFIAMRSYEKASEYANTLTKYKNLKNKS